MKKNHYSFLLVPLLITLLPVLCKCDDKEEPKPEPDIISSIVSELNFTSDTNNQTITFTTNKEWEATVSSSKGDASWCSVSPLGGSAGKANITISTTENIQ